MVSEARFRCAPVRHGVTVRFVRGLEFRFVPVFFQGRIALEVEGFLIGFAQARIENKLGGSAGIAHALRLRQSHVIRHAVFRLAGCEALQKSRPAILRIPSRMATVKSLGALAMLIFAQ